MRKRNSLEVKRSRLLQFKVSAAEFQQIKDRQANSTCNGLSEYIRNCSLGQPVTVYYRNQSFDDFVTEIVLLRKTLQAMLATTNNQEKMTATVAAIQQNINQLADYVRNDFNHAKDRPNHLLSRKESNAGQGGVYPGSQLYERPGRPEPEG